jgi:hypothetical protein
MPLNTDEANTPSPARAPRATGTPNDTNSIQKVCAILRALGAHAPQRLTELAASAGLNKVTALRSSSKAAAPSRPSRCSMSRVSSALVMRCESMRWRPARFTPKASSPIWNDV